MNKTTAYSAHDILLMNYAAGRLCPYDVVIVAAHIALNAQARRRVAEFEALGGQLMCAEEPAAVTRECLSHILSRIETAPEKEAAKNAAPLPCDEKKAADLHVPVAVYALITHFCAQNHTHWKKLSRGVNKIDLKPEGARTDPHTGAHKRLRLMQLPPHQATPAHFHAGRELTLVLEGSFTDAHGHYSTGDIIIIDDPGLLHQPTATAEGCVCLSVTEAPLRFTAPLYRLLNAFLRN